MDVPSHSCRGEIVSRPAIVGGRYPRSGKVYPGEVTPEELANLAHLRRARDLMDREYARPLDVPALAQAALMSPAHFSRQFKAAYGESPYSYLMTRRIERAKALLRRGVLLRSCSVWCAPWQRTPARKHRRCGRGRGRPSGSPRPAR